jgi:hypothetical protein
LVTNLKRNPVFYFIKLAQKYGDVYTFWLGSEPLILIHDCKIAVKLLNKAEFSDRFSDSVANTVNELTIKKIISVLNYTQEYKALRKISIEATRYFIFLYTHFHFLTTHHSIISKFILKVLFNEYYNIIESIINKI